MTRRLCLRHDPRCSIWTARLFKNARTSDVGHHNEQIEENWMSFDEPERELIWPHLLVYLLHIWPGYALQFIRVLVHQPGVKNIEPDILADAFAHMSVIHARRLYAHRSWTHFRSWNVTNFVPTFTHFLRNYCCTAANRHICTQDLIYNLTRLADIEDLKVVFDLLEDANVFEFFDTILHYANTFAKAGEYKYALRCLVAIDRRAKEREQAISIANLERFRWTCALILRKSSGKGRNYHETTSIVTAFVELGSKLDILLYNVIMHNAMDAGDYSTAFKVYNSLEDNGLEPDKHTFSILLHGCTMTEDPFKFAEFANYCARIANEQRDSWLAADYLYYLTLRLIDPSISSMTPDQDQGVDAPPSLRSMTPPPMAFYLILQMYIQRASSSSDTDLWNLYLRFRQLVRTRSHPVLANLAENPVVWNAFLLAFARNRQFEWASQLIRDMTDHNPQPNVYSWNIFMQGFFKAEQVQAAERVFQLVRARGVEPDQFTYLTLLKGYIRAQHIEKIGETMDFVESEQQMDPMLVQALGRIHNRKRLMLALEKSQARREEDRRIKEEKKAESERKRWEKPFQREEEEQVTFGSALKPAPLQFGSFGADMGFKKGSE
ncbi:hypothetical protein CC80DRAFT_465921 [Byssothecium circinans]|uniref:TPR-like protein n=1 Tax=Byssothecium circinans TaxID=147558 RepID=A0A6A5U7B1_9PLEO|nr:hypothetical protein CC80DRAFT_465921 [Byssothecium circinans]